MPDRAARRGPQEVQEEALEESAKEVPQEGEPTAGVAAPLCMESNGHTTRARWYRRDGSVRSRLRLALALGLLSALVLPGGAGATVGSVAMSGSVSPAPASATSTPVSLALSYDATYSSGFSPGVQRFTFHLDNDIAFDTVGISQCSLASISNATRAAALAACPGSVVGSGNTVWLGSGGTTLNGVIDAFDGKPSSGSPTIYLHDAIYNSTNQEAVDTTSVAVLSPSALGGDFGTRSPSHGHPPGWEPPIWPSRSTTSSPHPDTTSGAPPAAMPIAPSTTQVISSTTTRRPGRQPPRRPASRPASAPRR